MGHVRNRRNGRRSFLQVALVLLASLTLTESSLSASVATDDASIILFYGQSNAGAGGNDSPKLVEPVFPDRVFSFAGSRQSYGSQLADPTMLVGLGPLSDDKRYAPFPATAMAYALATRGDEKLFFYTVWYGGQPLPTFLPGGDSFASLVEAASAARQALAARQMASRVTALVFIQGEAGPPGRSVYRPLLDELLDKALSALALSTGQHDRPLAILVQANASNALPASNRDVALAQWDAAESRPGDTILAGPMYQCPLVDNVHQSAAGRMVLADMLSLAYDARVTRGKPFSPLHPTSASRRGSDIVIRFERPEGSLPLVWDRSWVPATPWFGFAVAEPAKAQIEAIAITGPSEVTIHLDRLPTGPVTIRYAMDQPRMKGWAPGRGQLIAPTPQRSAFAGLGHGLPETVSHYAIRFELTVD